MYLPHTLARFIAEKKHDLRTARGRRVENMRSLDGSMFERELRCGWMDSSFLYGDIIIFSIALNAPLYQFNHSLPIVTLMGICEHCGGNESSRGYNLWYERF